jgi:hypothetical protein
MRGAESQRMLAGEREGLHTRPDGHAARADVPGYPTKARARGVIAKQKDEEEFGYDVNLRHNMSYIYVTLQSCS